MSKVALEVAEAEFTRFAEAMDLDLDKSKMDADDQKSLAEVKAKVLRAMEDGRLVIDEKGQPVFTPHSGAAITFYEPTGASFMAMDSKKKGQDIAKMYAVMADMTHVDAKVFATMANRDLKVCQAVVSLFLG